MTTETREIIKEEEEGTISLQYLYDLIIIRQNFEP